MKSRGRRNPALPSALAHRGARRLGDSQSGRRRSAFIWPKRLIAHLSGTGLPSRKMAAAERASAAARSRVLPQAPRKSTRGKVGCRAWARHLMPPKCNHRGAGLFRRLAALGGRGCFLGRLRLIELGPEAPLAEREVRRGDEDRRRGTGTTMPKMIVSAKPRIDSGAEHRERYDRQKHRQRRGDGAAERLVDARLDQSRSGMVLKRRRFSRIRS